MIGESQIRTRMALSYVAIVSDRALLEAVVMSSVLYVVTFARQLWLADGSGCGGHGVAGRGAGRRRCSQPDGTFEPDQEGSLTLSPRRHGAIPLLVWAACAYVAPERPRRSARWLCWSDRIGACWPALTRALSKRLTGGGCPGRMLPGRRGSAARDGTAREMSQRTVAVARTVWSRATSPSAPSTCARRRCAARQRLLSDVGACSSPAARSGYA